MYEWLDLQVEVVDTPEFKVQILYSKEEKDIFELSNRELTVERKY